MRIFDALYMIKCMESVGSLVSGAVLLALDLIQNMYHCWRLHKRVQKREAYIHRSIVNVDHKALIQKSITKVLSRTHSILCIGPIDRSCNSVALDPVFRTSARPVLLMPTPKSIAAASYAK